MENTSRKNVEALDFSVYFYELWNDAGPGEFLK
jgi:hypothetical protein